MGCDRVASERKLWKLWRVEDEFLSGSFGESFLLSCRHSVASAIS